MTDDATRPSSLSIAGRVPVLAVIAVAVFSACIQGVRKQPTSGIAPAAADSIHPVDSAVADSLVADSLRLDSLARDSLRSDSLRAAAKDSLTDSLGAGKTVEPVKKATKRPPRECILDFSNNPPDSRALVQTFPDSSRNVFVGGGFLGTCQGENNTISADSLEYYETAGIMNLYGNVLFIEPNKYQLSAATVNYFRNDERFFAEGGVTLTQLSTGSTFAGQRMEYYRAVPGIRETSRLFAPFRPMATLRDKDSTGADLPPIVISANVMEDQGDSLLYAWGAVVIERENINGTSDSASFDKGTSQARLIRSATITSREEERPFTLKGDTIELFTKERELTRVVAKHESSAVSGDLTMTSANLDLRLANQELERAFAFGEGRARAITKSQELEADSLFIRLARQRILELRAVGQASAISTPDSTKIRTEDRDMLFGDSVFAMFDTVATPKDTAQPNIREIMAIGAARSLFHIASRRGRDCPPSLNYARGTIIRILFDSGSVKTVQVDSNASGVFLEPVQDSLDPANIACGGSGTDSAIVKKDPPETVPGSHSVTPERPVGPPAAERKRFQLRILRYD